MEQKLENIYENLKMNPHKYMHVFKEERVILAYFNTLENAINMLIDITKYSYDVSLIYDSCSKEYRTALYLHNDDQKK